MPVIISKRFLALLLLPMAAFPLAASQPGINLPPYEKGIVASNGFWFLHECRSADPIRLARCDGFIQGVAAGMRARRWTRAIGRGQPNCFLQMDPLLLRQAILSRPAEFRRSPAPESIETALNRAFPCRLPPQ